MSEGTSHKTFILLIFAILLHFLLFKIFEGMHFKVSFEMFLVDRIHFNGGISSWSQSVHFLKSWKVWLCMKMHVGTIACATCPWQPCQKQNFPSSLDFPCQHISTLFWSSATSILLPCRPPIMSIAHLPTISMPCKCYMLLISTLHQFDSIFFWET